MSITLFKCHRSISCGASGLVQIANALIEYSWNRKLPGFMRLKDDHEVVLFAPIKATFR